MSEVFRPAHYLIFEGDHLTIRGDAKVSPSMDAAEYRVVRFAGIASGPLGSLQGDLSEAVGGRMLFSELADYFGEWIAVARRPRPDGEEYLVASDPLGLAPVFYAGLPLGGIILSDSFSGVVEGIMRSGGSVRLDVGHYISSVSAATSHFENPSVRRTMAEQIRILPPNRAIAIGPSGVAFIDRQCLGDSASITDYSGLVTRGISFAVQTIKALASDEELSTSITLSGGVDSRLVLALVTAAGVQRQFQVVSSDPRTWPNRQTADTIQRDVVIADQIRRDLGMRWEFPGSTKQLQFDFQDSLAFHQSFKSNFAFNFSPGFTHTIRDSSFVTLRGGAGEMLRSTHNASIVGHQIAQEPSWGRMDPRNALVEWYTRRLSKHAGVVEPVKRYMAESVQWWRGDSIEEVMNEQYLHTRNRTHFGHLRQSNTSNNTSIHILGNAFFLAARRMLSYEERAAGRLVRDIFQATAPELLKYPFETQEATSQLGTHPQEVLDLDSSAWVRDYDGALKDGSQSTMVAGWSAQDRGIRSPYDRDGAARSYLRSSLRDIEEMVEDPTERQVVADMHRNCLKDVESRPHRLFTLVAKVASAVELARPSVARGTGFRVEEQKSAIFGFRTPSPRQRMVPRDGRSERAISEVELELSLHRGRLRARVISSAGHQPATEFAFYLYSGSEIVEKSWYSDKAEHLFEMSGRPGVYRARVFLRPRSRSSPDYGVPSNSLRI